MSGTENARDDAHSPITRAVVDDNNSGFLVPDHEGDLYWAVLERLHAVLQPKTYLEIGTAHGASLTLAKCASLAIDPYFQLNCDAVGRKPACILFQVSSDAFFAEHDPTLLPGSKIDFAFLDGMHLFEYVLRDFMNTEKHCKPNSIVALHDCIPTDLHMARRDPNASLTGRSPPHPDWWTGDVWKMLLIFKRYRPDLKVHVFDSAPTGLVLVTSLDPGNQILRKNYEMIVNEFEAKELATYGLQRFHRDVGVGSTRLIGNADGISELLLARLTDEPSKISGTPSPLHRLWRTISRPLKRKITSRVSDAD